MAAQPAAAADEPRPTQPREPKVSRRPRLSGRSVGHTSGERSGRAAARSGAVPSRRRPPADALLTIARRLESRSLRVLREEVHRRGSRRGSSRGLQHVGPPPMDLSDLLRGLPEEARLVGDRERAVGFPKRRRSPRRATSVPRENERSQAARGSAAETLGRLICHVCSAEPR